MYKIQLWSCIALTLALITHSAPASSSTKEMRQQLEQLLLDLKSVLSTVKNCKTTKLNMLLLSLRLYMPKKITELKHLQCLVEELKPLEEVLNEAENNENNRDLISNINVTALALKGSGTTVICEDDNKVKPEEFLNKWIIFCQSIISTLT